MNQSNMYHREHRSTTISQDISRDNFHPESCPELQNFPGDFPVGYLPKCASRENFTPTTANRKIADCKTTATKIAAPQLLHNNVYHTAQNN